MTKEQKLTIYKEALRYFEGDEMRHIGFCSYFYHEQNIDVYNENNFQKIFPELYKQRPNIIFHDSRWFRSYDNEPRAQCLRAAIEDLLSQK